MKKTVSLILACALMLLSLAACGGNPDYLKWKSADYNSASDADKLKCVETFINATLKSQGSDELSGNDLTISAKAVQQVLEENLAAYEDKTVEDVIRMAAQSASGE